MERKWQIRYLENRIEGYSDYMREKGVLKEQTLVSADWCGRRRAGFRHLAAVKLYVFKGWPGSEFMSKMITEALEMSNNLWTDSPQLMMVQPIIFRLHNGANVTLF